MNARKLVFALLVLNLMIGLLGLGQMLISGVTGWLSIITFLQVLGSFCVVCLSYWVATDKEKHA